MNGLLDFLAENVLSEEKKENKDEKKDEIAVEETFENINSPQLIQNILHLSTNSSKISLDLENSIIKSLMSINDLVTTLVLDNKNEENDIEINSNFNPFLHALNKKNDLYKLDFEEINAKNKFLNQKIKQYNELKQKISDYKNEKNKENKELSDKEKMQQKLFLVHHPLISIFENEINVKEIKNELHKEYLNKMEDHTEYSYTASNNLLYNFNNVNLNNLLHIHDEEEEDQENDDLNDDEEPNNEDEEDEGSFVDGVYNDGMVEEDNANNNNNIEVIEMPNQAINVQQPNADNNNDQLPNQAENIQQQNGNIHIENAELPNQVENSQQQNENNNNNNQNNANEEP